MNMSLMSKLAQGYRKSITLEDIKEDDRLGGVSQNEHLCLENLFAMAKRSDFAPDSPEEDDFWVYYLIIVDFFNSTNLRKQFKTNGISDISQLWEKVYKPCHWLERMKKDPADPEDLYALVDELIDKAFSYHCSLYSFITKSCLYADVYLFHRDNFYIYDRNVKTLLGVWEERRIKEAEIFVSLPQGKKRDFHRSSAATALDSLIHYSGNKEPQKTPSLYGRLITPEGKELKGYAAYVYLLDRAMDDLSKKDLAPLRDRHQKVPYCDYGPRKAFDHFLWAKYKSLTI